MARFPLRQKPELPTTIWYRSPVLDGNRPARARHMPRTHALPALGALGASRPGGAAGRSLAGVVRPTSEAIWAGLEPSGVLGREALPWSTRHDPGLPQARPINRLASPAQSPNRGPCGAPPSQVWERSPCLDQQSSLKPVRPIARLVMAGRHARAGYRRGLDRLDQCGETAGSRARRHRIRRALRNPPTHTTRVR